MPAKGSSSFLDDTDWDGEQDDSMNLMHNVRMKIEAHKKKRHNARQQILQRYEAKVEQVTEEFQRRVEHEQRRVSETRAEQLDRLVKAVQLRDAKEKAIRDRIGRLYESNHQLKDMLMRVYEGREKAASASSPELKRLVGQKSKRDAFED